MKIIEKKIGDLVPYENNPRLNDQAVDAVANSIKEFGFRVPVVIDKDGVIVAGHTRVKAAEKLKMKKVPCIVVDDLTEEQVREFRLMDNKTSELAEWDFDEMKKELDEIKGIDMSDFGFMMEEIEKTKEALTEKSGGCEGSGEIDEILCPRCGSVVEVV